ncbi:MAG: branched-chain amino acid ABC transporter permease [Planctomycetes bacterium]|nr:branched-chain amino acid ABC transporter permease [Planctomycetota bacterium]
MAISAMLVVAPLFCATVNWGVDRLVYRPIRHAPKLTVLVSAIGVSFVFVNLGMFWGGLPMDVFGGGNSAASPRSFPELLGNANLLGADAPVEIRAKEVLVFAVTLPLLGLLTWLIKGTSLGRAMRACAQNPVAARLMGIDVDRVIGRTFVIGGALAGVASVIASLYSNTISFQMGFRGGMDAFTAAVLGGIGNLPGAVIGALVIGLVRSYTQFALSDEWASVMVFAVLILILVFRPSGILGSPAREKV